MAPAFESFATIRKEEKVSGTAMTTCGGSVASTVAVGVMRLPLTNPMESSLVSKVMDWSAASGAGLPASFRKTSPSA